MSSSQFRRWSFEPKHLNFIENNFQTILVESNIIGKFIVGEKLLANLSSRATRESVTRTASSSQRGSESSPQSCNLRRPPATTTPSPAPFTPARPSATAPSPSAPESSKRLPDSLRKCNLLCTQDGVILWDMVTELISLEYLFHLHTKDNIAWDALECNMKKNKVKLP